MDRLLHITGMNTTTAPVHRPLTPYQETVRALSNRLVQASRPIRVLDAVRWDDDIETAFFATGGRELPRVARDYYATRPLSFDPDHKHEEYRDLERDVRRRLGDDTPAGRLLTRRCQEGQALVELIAQRGTPAFAAVSGRLYGSATDSCRDGGPPLAQLGRTLSALLERRPREEATEVETQLSAAEVVCELSSRLTIFFKEMAPVRVRLSDAIIADAAAGFDYIKVRGDARFSAREVRLLEVHEGWVHLGTTLNAQAQPICTFLTKGTPSTTVTQEGLAVLTEVLASASYPSRVRRIVHRIEAVARAESGATFLDVYRFYLDEGYEPREAYQHSTRVFRGSLPENCGPFTKDLSYGKGFVQVFEFVRAAVRAGQERRVQLLFCGKTSLAEAADLTQLADEGLLRLPRHLPPPFAEPSTLSARMSFAHLWAAPLSRKREHTNDSNHAGTCASTL